MTLANRAEKGCKADASCLAHLLQNCFWLPTKLSFKICPLWLKNFLFFWLKCPLFNKSISILEKCFKTLSRSFLFIKKAILTPFSTLVDSKNYLWNDLKTSYLSKGVTNPLLKIKSFTFNQQSGFQTKDLWLSFVLKVFDFISRAKFLLKFNLVLKEKGIASDLLNKKHCEKIFVCGLPKV